MKYSATKFYVLLCLLFASPPVALAAELPDNLKSIEAFRQVSDTLYTAGQPQAEAFADLAKIGVRHVINLRPPSETPEMNEASLATHAHMAYYNIPIGGVEDWTRENVNLLDNLLNKLAKEKVLLHCSSSNRVGALIALRAAWIQGLPLEDAIQAGRAHGLSKLEGKVRHRLSE